ncbi:unnamed protein product [Tetraodon nigroviridis]|uniref:(spotted green pufferfish) hypothetical protein n=1 Tax=Tetraodon nigroviridis TaxID=99883 RepID=Q4S542_TETNG|nr:unnamed protein product [Tetraodon nigroviridis]
MNFIRSISIGRFLGQKHRELSKTWTYRRMCNKPQDPKGEASASTVPAPSPRASFKVPGYRPSEMDKRFLLWSGRYKTADQIPEFVSFEMIDVARNRARVTICYVMIAATVVACAVMVILGKRAAGRHESLTSQNMEKKAKWKEEYRRNQEAAMSEKPQG